jgi:hypothetical protein
MEMAINDTPFDETGAEAAESEGSDLFQTIMIILMAVVAVAGAVVAWRAALIGGEVGDEDFAGLQAGINAAETQIVSTASLYESYRAYVSFTYYRQIANLMYEELETETSEDLLEDATTNSQLASDNELFFSKRYLDKNGAYNRERNLQETIATAGKRLDLNPAPHFDAADQARRKTNTLVAIFIVQASSLLFFTFAQAIHPSRNALRYSMGAVGTILLVFSIGAALWVLFR